MTKKAFSQASLTHIALTLILLLTQLILLVPARADIQTLGEGVTINFPAAPSAEQQIVSGFAYKLPDNEALYLAGKIKVPSWVNFVFRRAPDAVPDILDEKLAEQLSQKIPEASITRQTHFTLNGFTGTEFELNIPPSTRTDNKISRFERMVARMVVIDGEMYMYGVLDHQSKPVTQADIDRFMDSLQIKQTHQPGDAEEQLTNLGFIMIGTILAVLLIIILLIVWLLIYIQKSRRKRLQP